jgi:hypothetical protein
MKRVVSSTIFGEVPFTVMVIDPGGDQFLLPPNQPPASQFPQELNIDWMVITDHRPLLLSAKTRHPNPYRFPKLITRHSKPWILT